MSRIFYQKIFINGGRKLMPQFIWVSKNSKNSIKSAALLGLSYLVSSITWSISIKRTIVARPSSTPCAPKERFQCRRDFLMWNFDFTCHLPRHPNGAQYAQKRGKAAKLWGTGISSNIRQLTPLLLQHHIDTIFAKNADGPQHT